MKRRRISGSILNNVQKFQCAFAGLSAVKDWLPGCTKQVPMMNSFTSITLGRVIGDQGRARRRAWLYLHRLRGSCQ